MIQEQRTANVKSTMVGEKVVMGIEEGSMGHIMGLLTNLYADPITAIIREYTTNGLDAHIAAGEKRPVEVTLPSALAPFFKVKDYGTGLSVDDIHNIYSQYGASTKRDTNAQVGSFGLGCKAALAYADQFTLTSCKDGTKVVVSVSRDQDGAGSMLIADTLQCDEGNGTEVIIPAKTADDFTTRAAKFFQYWQPGTVLVNGQAPARFEGLQISDYIWLVERDRQYSAPDSCVVMGNVAYPVPNGSFRDTVPSNTALVAYIPLGSVTLPPNRESLIDTPRTQQTLESVRVAYHANIHGAVQREVDKATTAEEAVATVIKWAKYVNGTETFKWGGHTLPTAYDEAISENIMVSDAHAYRRTGGVSHIRSIRLEQWPTTIWVENFSPGQHTAVHKRKMLKWAEDAGLPVARFAMFRDKVRRNHFMDPNRIVSWETVNQIKLERTNTLGYSSRPARLSGSYDCYIDGIETTQVPANDLNPGGGRKPLFFRNGNVRESYWHAAVLTDFFPGCTLVSLPANRIAKFQRDFPHARTAGEGIESAKKIYVAKMTQEQREALALYDMRGLPKQSHASPYNALALLDSKRVVDPELQSEIRSAKVDVTTLVARRQKLGFSQQTKHYNGALMKYPLFNVAYNDHDHLYLYLNAAYVAENRSNA